MTLILLEGRFYEDLLITLETSRRVEGRRANGTIGPSRAGCSAVEVHQELNGVNLSQTSLVLGSKIVLQQGTIC